MAGKEKSMIVIKKINVVAAGHHGGSWKVALADFMTALMAFFLVMWLLSQSAETKKAVSDYFSSPSVIEYNFQNFGVELTLEKLFLDLVNEPLKAFQQFMEPADKTPNILDTGSQKVVISYVMDKLKDLATNLKVNDNGFEFQIPDNKLFKIGTADPTNEFVPLLEKLKTVTTGVEDSTITVTSQIFIQSIPGSDPVLGQNIAAQRADMIANKIKAGLEHTSTDVVSSTDVREKRGEVDPAKLIGFIKVVITQKEVKSDGKPTRKLEALFGNEKKADMSAYEKRVSKEIQGNLPSKKIEPQMKKVESPVLENPINQELQEKFSEEKQ